MAARLGINAYPDPVRKGQTITVGGKLKTTVIARRDGTFRSLYLGNGVTGRKASKGDYVNVR